MILASKAPALAGDEGYSEIGDGWQSRLKRSKSDGEPLSILANVIVAFEHAPEWRNVLCLNELTQSVTANADPPWDDLRSVPFEWADPDDIRSAEWFQHHGLLVGKEVVGQAVQAVARDHPFHPIRDYLDSLEWDGEPRLDRWMPSYLGAEDTPYAQAVGAKTAIGAVARIYVPGSKLDTMTVLEGGQGRLKSTALRTLVGPEWFTDEIADLGSKDSSMQVLGVWLVEISELDAMSRAQVSAVKAFISRQVDRYRPPYGRRVVSVPRRCFCW